MVSHPVGRLIEPRVSHLNARQPMAELINRRRRLTAEEIRRLATMDPTTTINRGRLRSLDRSTDPTDPARPLLEALLAVAPQPRSAPAEFVNPARPRPIPRGAARKRALTPADIEWLRGLPSEPAAVSSEDVATLATMVQEAASSSELRLLVARFQPIWAHHDVLEQQHERGVALQEARAAARFVRSRQIEQAAIDALAPAIHDQFPELRESEVRARASEQLREQWASVATEVSARIGEASSTAWTPEPRPMPGAEGLSDLAIASERASERAEQRREARTASPVERLHLVDR